MGQGSEPTPQLGRLEEALSKDHRTLDSGRDSGMSSPCLTQGTYPQGFLLVGGRARMLRKPSGSSILESLEHPSSCSSKSKVFPPSVGKSPRCKRSALSPKSPRANRHLHTGPGLTCDLWHSAQAHTCPKNTGRQATQTQPHHIRGNLIRCVPIQVELEGHHLVVVRLQLALHHLVPSIADLEGAPSAPAMHAPAMRVPTRAPATPPPPRHAPPATPPAGHAPRVPCPLTFKMVSRGRLALSCRERARVDLRWCFRAALPSSLPPPKVPSQLSLSSFPEVTSEPP